MTVDQLISGSIAKFNYAKNTFERLADMWIAQSNKVEFDGVFEGERVAMYPKIPENNMDMSLLAGDIFHSLRCSLEYLYRALYIQKVGQAPELLQFPSKKEDIIKRKENLRLRDELTTLFDRYEPVITTISAANNQDKHRLLLFTSLKYEPLEIETSDGGLNFVSRTNPSEWSEASSTMPCKIGIAIRPRYVMVIEKHKGNSEGYLTLDNLKDLILEFVLCLEAIISRIREAKLLV